MPLVSGYKGNKREISVLPFSIFFFFFFLLKPGVDKVTSFPIGFTRLGFFDQFAPVGKFGGKKREL